MIFLGGRSAWHVLSVEGNKEKAGTLSKSESVHDRPSTCRSPQSRAFGEMADGKNGDLCSHQRVLEKAIQVSN